MPFSRYARAPILAYGQQYGTSRAVSAIRSAIKNGQIQTKQVVLRGVERLDTMAGVIYGDGRLWWVLAAASNVGWGMQVPPGTILQVPNLTQVSALVA
jgi:hypothetical protein